MIPVSLRIDIGMARRNGTTGCISLWSAAFVLALPLLFPNLFPAAIWRTSLFSVSSSLSVATITTLLVFHFGALQFNPVKYRILLRVLILRSSQAPLSKA
jgi:hypothetical protein